MGQSKEWGIQAIQSSFHRVKDTLMFEEQGERKIAFSRILLLHKPRARLVGINQISTR